MLTLTANQIDKKNQLADGGAWLLLAKVEITGVKTLDYDNQGVLFTLGETVKGTDSGAYGKILEDSNPLILGSGTLTLGNVHGEFVNNEDLDGYADANGTLSDSDVTYRFARNTEDVTWDGETWTAFPMEIEGVRKTSEGKFDDISARLSNADGVLSFYVERLDGMVGEKITLYVVHSDLLSEAAAMEEEFEIMGCTISGTWIDFSLSARYVFGDRFPLFKYKRNFCRWQFKGTECGYSGVDTTCGRTLIACRDKSNIGRFGGFPSIPGGFYEEG